MKADSGKFQPTMRRCTSLLAAACLFLLCAGSRAQSVRSVGSREVRFRFPAPIVYRIDAPALRQPASDRVRWLRAWPVDGAPAPLELGARVVVELKPGANAETILAQGRWPIARRVRPGLVILEAADPWAAATEANRLSELSDVQACYPVFRRPFRKRSPYAARPNDPYFGEQFYLENRDASGLSLGPDLNARGAWAVTRGAGTVIAVADDGIELSHPEFITRADHDLHLEFETFTTNALPVADEDNHATSVAGFALAEGGNACGISGLAPSARPASWKIFTGDQFNVSDEGMMDLYQYRSNAVTVQNHSWGNPSAQPMGLSVLEDQGISNAVTFGRQGRGVVMVRAGGNGREFAANVNDDGAASDPRAIAVAATGQSGRVASYSSRGAPLLVAAPGGDLDRGLFTTDRPGASGYNSDLENRPDYAFDTGMRGTSFACPAIAGLAALIVSANPDLTYRDVQHILILASRQFDRADPDVRPNGAGLLVSHNVGYGVPDAGEAVRLARSWPPRPPLTILTLPAAGPQAVPDDGLRLHLTGTDVPPDLNSIPATPGWGPHADAPTAAVPLVDLGFATSEPLPDLRGRAALFEYDGSPLDETMDRVARAGAVFAVAFNPLGTIERLDLPGTDFVPIPTVSISQDAGQSLRAYLQAQSDGAAWLELHPARFSIAVSQTLLLEHVGLRVRYSHPRRGDLRLTLVSPAGTRSVLQHLNPDDFPGSGEWTYWSSQHFLEGSPGTWTLEVSDQAAGNSGTVLGVELILRGVALTDLDGDGLDDDWERRHFGSLLPQPADDPEADGFNNAREQILDTDPRSVDVPFALDLSPWDENLVRLSWPGVTNRVYQVLAADEVAAPLAVVAAVPGRFPQTEWFTARTNLAREFFRVRAAEP